MLDDEYDFESRLLCLKAEQAAETLILAHRNLLRANAKAEVVKQKREWSEWLAGQPLRVRVYYFLMGR